MNIVMIIPTGIGCEIGGHAGDANPVAKLFGSCCDKLILHPNVVNASDINEMPENALYVEGSMLDRFLEEKISLKEVKQNKILVVANAPLRNETINAVNASRITLGLDVELLELKESLLMYGDMKDGKASGEVHNWIDLIEQIKDYSFDALAITTPIEITRETAKEYFKNGGVNPWGGVEAIASKLIAEKLNKPVAHSPIQSKEVLGEVINKDWDFVCDPRMAPEIISQCFLHCVLKGLQRAPRLISNAPYNVLKGDMTVRDIDFLISPHGCWGRPHDACFVRGIPIIEVMENKTIYSKRKVTEIPEHYTIQVDNYLEAVGLIMCKQASIISESVRRPVKPLKIKRKD